MNCFNHRDKPAIGICKSCGKGLCGDCVAELPNVLACKDSCEKQVDLIGRHTDSDAETKSDAKWRLCDTRVRSFFAGIFFAVALGVCIVAVYFEKDNPLIAYLALVIWLIAYSAFGVLWGIYELIAGIFRMRRKLKYLRIKEKTT
jgi:hypothetical protein